jgi:hypothetical protein
LGSSFGDNCGLPIDIYDTVPGDQEPETINESKEMTIFHMVSKYCQHHDDERLLAKIAKRANQGASAASIALSTEELLSFPEVMDALEKALQMNTQIISSSYRKAFEDISLRNRFVDFDIWLLLFDRLVVNL